MEMIPSQPGWRPDPSAYGIRRDWRGGLRGRSSMLAFAVIVNLLLLYLLQALAGRLLGPYLIARPDRVELANELYTAILYFVAFLLPYVAYAKLMGYPCAEDIPHDRPSPKVLAACLGVAMGVSTLGAFLSACASAFFSVFGLYPMEFPNRMPQGLPALLLYLANMTLLPAVIEEVAHRGIVLGSLRRYGDGFAIVVSAAVFSMLHRNMVQIPNAFVMGLALGYFMVKTNSIYTAMALHFANNLIAVLLQAATDGMGPAWQGIAQGALWIFYLAGCAVGLIYLLAVRRVRLRLAPSGCPVGPARLHGWFWTTIPAAAMLLLFAWTTFLNFSRY